VTLKTLQKWINHPAYLLICVGLGLFSWSFSFDSVTTRIFANRKPAGLQLSELASKAELRKEVEATDYRQIQKLSEPEMIAQLEKVRPNWNKPFGPNALSLAQAEAVIERRYKKLPKRFENNPVFQMLQKLTADDSASVDYDDLLVCDKSRLFYESRLHAYPVLSDLVKERSPASQSFATDCVVYSMRQFQVPKMNFANCAKSVGAPQVPGAKPCITPPLVNLTYNAFVDATECLNLNAKHLMPKIDFESGFFLNSFGGNKEAGIGQLTEPAIQEVNKYYSQYFAEIEKAAATKESCANLVKVKSLLSMAPSGPEQRCSMVGLPENPLRNIFYTALYHRINMDMISGIKFVSGQDYIQNENSLIPVQNNERDQFSGLFKTYRIKDKLELAGLHNPNLHYFKEMLATLGDHSGVETSVRLLSQYLDQRRENQLLLTMKDFDFQSDEKAQDVDGQMKNAVDVAASFVLSSILSSKDSSEEKKLKAKRRKELPKKWAEAYMESFPVYLAYRANGYDGKSFQPFAMYGYPGYLNVLTGRQEMIRDLFINAQMDPNICTDPKFLKAE
jgi:hypothetical protein